MYLHVTFLLPLTESKSDAQSRHDYNKTYQTQIKRRYKIQCAQRVSEITFIR